MFRVESGIKRGLRRSIIGLLAGVATLTVASNAADARRHHHQASQDGQQAQAGRHAGHHSIRESGYSPPSAAFVLDANTGKTLEESNADSLRHPASLTKIMTLYLLFERLDAGKMKLGTQMPVSEHAAEQAPTKLGLRPGQHIAVEDAIRGLVTRSANDAAVVIAEAVGGDEHTFAQMMSAKAHALGMSRTTYVNASGLPDDDQVTTARDQALLGRLIAERFPVYYTYFSTPSFVFRGEEIRNHNHLLGSVQGVDGIKTGYTNASGFNLVTSVRRNNRHIVAVVLGGSSAGARDARMRALIEEHIAEASTHRTLTAVADAAAEPARTTPPRPASAPASGYALSSAASVPVPGPSPVTAAAPMLAPVATPPKPRSGVGSSEPIKPIAVKTIKVKLAPQHTAALAPAAAMIPIEETNAPPAEPAKAAAVEPAAATPPAAEPTKLATVEPPPAPAAAPVAAPIQPAPQPTAAAPAPLAPAAAAPEPVAAAPVQAARTEQPAQVAKIEPPAPPTRSLQAHTGWIIQIGAYESETEAKQHLDAAQSKAKSTLGHAERFTETVTKGDKTLYRARFAGLDKDEAEETCKRLRRNDIACITVKN